ncbi:MAG: DNA-binding protein [Clostridiales bacterium]|nr:DNA-binding protein [Clostridiales bacterium]
MIENRTEAGYLLDFYGPLLSERRRIVVDMYYNEDMSLSEIASEIGISRQGVRDIIVKASEELFTLESKLGMAGRFRRVTELAEKAEKLAENSGDPELLSAIRSIVKAFD